MNFYPEKESKFYDLRKRVISGLIFTTFALIVLIQGGLLATFFLAFCLAVLAWEVLYIFSSGSSRLGPISIFIPIFIFFIPFLNFYNFYPLAALLVAATVSTIFHKKKFLNFFCIVYLSTSIIIFQNTFVSEKVTDNSQDLIFIILCVVASDVGGYFFGRFIGGPKIWKSISPNKTWAGSLGGILLAITVCVTLAGYVQYTITTIVVLSFIMAVSTQAGDFFESWLKRKFNVKDSGFLLPGHGGLFDRLDGLLASVLVYGGLMYLLEIERLIK